MFSNETKGRVTALAQPIWSPKLHWFEDAFIQTNGEWTACYHSTKRDLYVLFDW